VESTQNFTANHLVTKHSLSERSCVIYNRNTEDGSWHASRGRYEGANFSAKQSSRKRLKHTLVGSVFDANFKYVISFDTDRSLLIETCEIPVKKSKNDDPRKVCLRISQVANVF
jgi:hypothetical protein